MGPTARLRSSSSAPPGGDFSDTNGGYTLVTNTRVHAVLHNLWTSLCTWACGPVEESGDHGRPAGVSPGKTPDVVWTGETCKIGQEVSAWRSSGRGQGGGRPVIHRLKGL